MVISTKYSYPHSWKSTEWQMITEWLFSWRTAQKRSTRNSKIVAHPVNRHHLQLFLYLDKHNNHQQILRHLGCHTLAYHLWCWPINTNKWSWYCVRVLNLLMSLYTCKINKNEWKNVLNLWKQTHSPTPACPWHWQWTGGEGRATKLITLMGSFQKTRTRQITYNFNRASDLSGRRVLVPSMHVRTFLSKSLQATCGSFQKQLLSSCTDECNIDVWISSVK